LQGRRWRDATTLAFAGLQRLGDGFGRGGVAMKFGLGGQAVFGGGRLAAAAAALVLVCQMGLGDATSVRAAGPESVADIAERLTPAVVNISTSQVDNGDDAVPMPDLPEGSPFREFFEEFFNRQDRDPQQPQRPRRVSSLGSGFVIAPEGIIVTNNHVIEQADEVEVNFADGTTLNAEVVGRDLKTDLAVLRVDPPQPLAYVEFGDAEAIRVGDWVMAIGNPFGLGGSVTLGIISARNRNINSGPYDDFIQTDAAINRGNSGGPLFNMDGAVVGINTAIISPTGGSIGIGFAIPTTIAKNVIDQLIEFGATRRGWLGVRIQSVGEDIATSLGLDEAKGALIADVTPAGPAEASGIRPGDVVVRFDGKVVSEMRDLPRIVADTPVGKKVIVELMRDGKLEQVEVEIGRLEEGEVVAQNGSPDDPEAQRTVLGMTLAPLSEELRQRFNIPADSQGAVVIEVDPDGPAAEKNIEPGDVITEAGERDVVGPADIEGRVGELQAEGRSSILLLVRKTGRDGDPSFVALRLE
jgi:serine protease Do